MGGGIRGATPPPHGGTSFSGRDDAACGRVALFAFVRSTLVPLSALSCRSSHPGARQARCWQQLGSAQMEAAQASGRPPQPHLTPGQAAKLADEGLLLPPDARTAAHWLVHEAAHASAAARGLSGDVWVGAPEEAPGMRDTPWRCLDKTHATSCNRCGAVRRGLGWSGSFCLHF